MSIAKKSIKWLVALFVIFALVLTASLAVGTFANANAESETEDVHIDVIVWATDSESNLGSYPTFAAYENDTRTITVYYGLVVPAAAQSEPLANAELFFAPTLTFGEDTVSPVSVVVNAALGVEGTYSNGILSFALANNQAGTLANLDCTSDQGNYIFYATYAIEDTNGSSIGSYTLGLGNVGTLFPGTAQAQPIPSNFSVPAADPDDDPIAYATVITDDTKSFTINSVVAKPVVDPTSLVYNGDAQDVFSGTNAGYTYTGATATDVDEYTVTFTLNQYYVWSDDFSTAPYEVDWEITKMQIDIPEEDDTEFVFTGSAQSYNVAASDYYTVTGTPQTAAGEYEITISLDDTDNTEWSDGTTEDIVYDFVIAKRSITVPVSAGTTYTYNGQAQSFAFSESPLTDAAYITITGTPQTDAGDYTVTAALTYPASTYWAADTTDTADKTYEFVIEKSAVTVTFHDESYSSAYLAALNIPSLDVSGTVASGDANALDIHFKGLPEVGDPVGTYPLTIAYNTQAACLVNYVITATDTANYYITKVQVPVPVLDVAACQFDDDVNHAYTYDGEYHEIYWTSATVPDSTIAIYDTKGATNAGNYVTKYSLVDTNNYEWVGGSTADIEYAWRIDFILVTKPTATTTTYYYSGSEQTYAFASAGDSNMYTVANDKRTNAGTQTVTATLSNANYKWADGTTANLEFTFTIKKLSVIAAACSLDNTFTYTGGEITCNFISEGQQSYFTITGHKQTNVGIYDVTETLNDPNNYKWSHFPNVSDDEPTAPYVQEKAFEITKKAVTIPTAISGLVYTGEEQVGVIKTDGSFYTLYSGSEKGTAVGNYSATYRLLSTTNTYWADNTSDVADKTVQFVISPILITVPTPADITYTYNGEEQSFQWASTPDALITITGTPQTNAGNYTITASIPANYAWNDEGHTTEAKTFPFVIAKVQITKPTPYGNNQYVYDSYNKQFMLDVVSAETGYYTVSNNIRRNAGSQTVTVSLKDKTNTEWADGTTTDLAFTLTVQKRPVNLSVSADAASHVYGNTPANVSISATGIIDAFSCSYKVVCVDGEAPYAEYTPTQFNEGLNAGHYTLNPVYNDINGNYDVTVSEPFSYEVIKREITIPTAISGLEYTGSAQVGVIKTDGSFYTLYSGSDEETAVGNYTATYSLKSTTNCYWAGDTTDVANKTVEWSIAKKSITKPSISASFKIYNGSSQSYSGSGTGYTFTGSGTDAGEYPVTVTLTDKDNSVWAGTDSADDYEVADKLVIAKKTVKLTLAKSADSSVYGNSIATITAGIDPDYAPINTADIGTVTYTAKNFQTNVVYTQAQFETVGTASFGYYILTAACSIDDPNYSVDAQTLPYEITKRPIEIPVLNQDDPSFVYNGSAQGISFFSGSLDDADYFTVSGTNSATNVGNYTYTATLNDATNCEWEDSTTAAKNYDWSITTRYIDVPTVVDDTFDYDGNEHSIGFSNVDNDYVNITYDTQSAVGVYTNTTIVALKAAHAGNIAWDDDGKTTTAKTYTLTIQVVEVNFTIVPVYNNAMKTGTAAAINLFASLPEATTYRWFKFTGYTFDDEAVTTVSLDMEGETVYANYAYNVGAGDVDGDSIISTTDVVLMRRVMVGLESDKLLANGAAAWDNVANTNDYAYGVHYVALDVNGSSTYRANDIVAVREALATGYGYKVIVQEGMVKVYKTNRVNVSNYEDLIDNIRIGNAVTITTDITAATTEFDEDLNIPVDIDLGNHKLTVLDFKLNTNTAGATLKVTNGTLYTVTGITVTAPNGNVVVADVNGYSYDGTVVNLAAYSESLHIEDDVAFYIYKAQVEENVDYDDVDHFKAALTEAAEPAQMINALSEIRIEETAARMADIAAIKADTERTEEQKAEDINALDVKKAIIEVPVDTHVVVEAAANLSAEKVVVKPQSDQTAETVTTFAIEVKNAAAEVVTVDISEVRETIETVDYYVVEEVTISGSTENVAIVSGDNTAAEVNKYVAQIGNTGYETLQAAINAAVNGDTIKLLASVADGIGLKTADDNKQGTKVGKTFTIDFAGYTYTVNGAAVGSSGTETQAMHWGAKDTITLKNGRFVVSEDAVTVPNPTTGRVVKMGMQNYADLTIRNMTMDFTKIPVDNYPNTAAYGAYANCEMPRFNWNDGSKMLLEDSTITFANACTKGIIVEVVDAVIKNSTINGSVCLNVGDDGIVPTLTVINSTITKGMVGYFATDIVVNDGNVYTLSDGTENFVAQIASTGYATFTEAITAAEDGDTITLLDDVTIENALSITKSLTIDLNGYTLTNGTGAAARPITIASGTDVTIENGTIENPNTASWGLLENYGTFTLDGVTANEYGSDGGAFLRNWSNANMIVRNCTLNGIGTGANQLVRNHNNTSGNTLLVEDSTLTSESTTDYPLIIRGNGTATFTRITVAGAMGGIGIEGNNVTITDSNFTDVAGEEYYGLWITNNYAGTNVTVNGGTFTGGRYGVLLGVDDDNQNKSDVNVTINGGTFVGINNDAIGISTKAKNQTTRTFTLTVNGGAFNSDPTAYVPAGYGVTEADGIYTVAPLTGVAAIGHVGYATLDEAAAAATTTDTVVLLADVTYGADRIVALFDPGFNLDLNGHTVTSNSTQGVTLYNNGYTATAICFATTDDSTVSNGTIVTAYGAGVYAAATTCTLENLTINANTLDTQACTEYSAAIRITSGGTVIINSGSYSGYNALAASNSGATFIVNGGTFSGRIFFGENTNSGVTKSITINGGTFTNVEFVNTNKGTLTITGGSFDADPTAYVPAGYGITEADGIYTVAPLTGVAYIGHVAYDSFDAAVAAAQDGDTIVLLADVTYGTDRVVPVWEIKAFNIDLNGKTFTTNSNQGITLSNNGYGASAICYGDNNNTSPARNIKVSNGTIRTAFGAGLYFDAAVTATLENLTVAQNYPANVQSTDEYSTAVRLTSGATVNIYSGTYSGKNAIVISNSGGYANIYGGDFRGALFINGGASSTKVLTIYGGTFDADPTAYVDTTAYDVTLADGIYTVTAKA